MTNKSKSANELDDANLGQKNAEQEKRRDAELSHMGELSKEEGRTEKDRQSGSR